MITAILLTVDIDGAGLLDGSLAGHAPPQGPGPKLATSEIHGAAVAERAEQVLLQVGLHVRVETVRVAVLRAAQEAQVRNGRGVEEVLEAAQHHSGAVDVARLQLPHGLDHGQRYLFLICFESFVSFTSRWMVRFKMMEMRVIWLGCGVCLLEAWLTD